MNFGRIVTAMVTPFDENNQLDIDGIRTLVKHLVSNGTDALVVGGTTGESPTLSYEEKCQLFQTVVQVVRELDRKIPVIAGTGSNNTKESIELTKQAEEIGADAIMLVTPYYNRPSQEGLYAHFRAIAVETNLPVMLYNIPGRSAVNLSAETTLRLAKTPNIVATKEASGDLEAMAEIIEQAPDHFSLYSGDDSLTLPVLSIGGIGVVSVASHVIGNEMQQMIQLFEEGQVNKASHYHRNLLPIMKSVFIAPNPTAVKAALELIGVPAGHVRLPLVPLSEKQQLDLEKIIKRDMNFSVS